MRLWRKKFLVIGIVFTAMFFLYWICGVDLILNFLHQLNIPGEALSTLSIAIPVSIDLLATVCLAIYAVSRPSKRKISVLNIFITLAIIVIGGFPALYLLAYLVAASGL